MVYDAISEQLKKQYPYKIELHAHTKGISMCSKITPEEMARVYSEAGYAGVVITNHFILPDFGEKTREEAIDWYVTGYEDTVNAAEKYGLKVLLGAEIRFTEAHHDYLIFGVDKEVLKTCYDYLDKGVRTFKKEAKLPDSLVIQAHPFRNAEPIGADCIDGVEVYNVHPTHNSRIGLAARFAKENGIKIITAGTDFHDEGWHALSALRMNFIPENSFDIARVLKEGDYILEVNGEIIIP